MSNDNPPETEREPGVVRRGGSDLSDMSRTELSGRVARSLFVSSAWGGLALVIGFFGNLVLARLLTPSDFGIIAIGATILLVANSIGDAGLGVGMVRWSRAPTRRELSDLTGIQLLITVAMTAGLGLIALQFGTGGTVTAVMLLALPFTSFQTAGRIIFMRGLRWELITLVDGTATVLFYAWAIGGALLGFGIWGLATAAVVRAVVGTVMVWIISDLHIVRPTLRDPRALMPVLGFGIRLQSAYLVIVFRDILVTFITALLGGVAVVGVWSLARRLMEVPLVLFSSIAKVIFPAMSHVLAAGDDAAPMVERASRVIAVVSSLSLTAFAGFTPALVPIVFGTKWSAVADILPWAAVAVLITSSVSVAVAGYLQADDRPQDVLRAAFTNAGGWLLVTTPLLPVLGATAVGVGWVCGATIEALVLARYARRACGARVLREVAVPLLSGTAGCAVGGALSILLEPGIVTALVAAASALAVTVGGLALFNLRALREGLAQLLNLARRISPSPV